MVIGRETADCAFSRFPDVLRSEQPARVPPEHRPAMVGDPWHRRSFPPARPRRGVVARAACRLGRLRKRAQFRDLATERLRHAGHPERPHYPNKRTGWPVASAAGLCQIRTLTADEVVMAKSVVSYAPRAAP
jgi:hypothetical protein